MKKLIFLLTFTILTLTLKSQTYPIAKNSMGYNSDQLIAKFGSNLKYKYQESPTYTLLYSNGSITFIIESGVVAEVIYLFRYKSDFMEFLANNNKFWVKKDNGSWTDGNLLITRELSEDAQHYISITVNPNCKYTQR